MNTPELRKKLHNQIECLDEKTLETVYFMFQDYFGGNKGFELTKSHKDLIDERLEDYEKNPQKIISWEESSRLLKKTFQKQTERTPINNNRTRIKQLIPLEKIRACLNTYQLSIFL